MFPALITTPLMTMLCFPTVWRDLNASKSTNRDIMVSWSGFGSFFTFKTSAVICFQFSEVQLDGIKKGNKHKTGWFLFQQLNKVD